MSFMISDDRYFVGIRLFQERHWFECHEVLEALWRETPRGQTRDFLQGLIQLAVSLEHWRRANPRGAAGQWQKASARLDGLPQVYAGLAIAELLAAFSAHWRRLDLDAAVVAQAEGRFTPPAVDAWPTPRWVDGGPPTA